ncbi:MAG: hypothetical protein ABW157_09985 [Candidatus Thiodiazotropha sp. LLP2]
MTGLQAGPASISGGSKVDPTLSYLGVARNMLPGVRSLADNKSSALALSLIAGHTMECLLKAYLSKEGETKSLKDHKVRHNLVALWKMAFLDGLPISEQPPDWLELLGECHDSPYYTRYSSGVNGIVLPNMDKMAEGIEEVARIVEGCFP